MNNIFSTILLKHGRDILRELRNAEKTVRKIARWENNRIFNIRCIRYKYTPISAILKTNITGKRAEQIIMKAEKQLLSVRVRHCNFTINKTT